MNGPSVHPTIAFATLGCKLNQFETDALATRFQDGGYRIVEFGEHADVIVINSCTVTNRADRKTRNLLYRALRDTRDGATVDDGISSSSNALGSLTGTDQTALVVLTGCYVESHQLRLHNNEQTAIVPNRQKHALFEIVEGLRRGQMSDADSSVFDFPVPSRVFHTRTMIKVQDGCDNLCTFCIIPSVRGRATSRLIVDAVQSAREAIRGGAKELVLTGVNMSRYRDGAARFPHLVREMLEIEGDFRLRISSLEPEHRRDGLVELFDHPKMAPHLHLCLQSASDRVLRAMRRRYSYGEFVKLVETLRRRYQHFNVTTDVIVGFPGETEEDFQQTLRSIDELEFGHVHVFPYSERDGTPAAGMPDSVPHGVRTERAARAREVAAATKERYRRRLLGARERLLVEAIEESDTTVVRGFGAHYVPVRASVDLNRKQPSETHSMDPGSTADSPTEKPALQNDFIDVRITGVSMDSEAVLIGTRV